MATPAKIVGSSELDQQAVIATKLLPLKSYGCKGSGHLGVGGPERGFSWNENSNEKKSSFPTLERNLRYNTCGCQETFRGQNTKRVMVKAKPAGEKTREKQVRNHE